MGCEELEPAIVCDSLSVARPWYSLKTENELTFQLAFQGHAYSTIAHLRLARGRLGACGTKGQAVVLAPPSCPSMLVRVQGQPSRCVTHHAARFAKVRNVLIGRLILTLRKTLSLTRHCVQAPLSYMHRPQNTESHAGPVMISPAHSSLLH